MKKLDFDHYEKLFSLRKHVFSCICCLLDVDPRLFLTVTGNPSALTYP